MLLQRSIIGNSRLGQEQYDEVQFLREMANNNERMHEASVRSAGQHMAVNAGFIPRDVYQDFDNVTVEQFRSDDGDTYLNDLLPLSRSLPIGKLTQQFRQSSDAGRVQTSMTGQIGVKMDQVEYTYDGSIVPIHDAGFSRNWREWSAQTSEGFDSLIDDNRETVRSVRKRLADDFLDGHLDTQGNGIVVDGLSWTGMRNDTRVAQVTLSFDFTDVTKTGDEIKAAFIAEVRNVMWITNLCEKDLTYYFSREIISNFERKFSTQYDAKIIMQELADLVGVAAIKTTSKLTGNQLMGFPLSADSVRPLVGMGLNTVAMPRPVYNSNYDFVVWAAIGFQVRTDFAGNTCAIYGET